MPYTVKKGDTLYGLYGSDWKKLSGYTGDPTKLQIGTQLPDLPGTTPTPTPTPTPTLLPGLGEEVVNRASGTPKKEETLTPQDQLIKGWTDKLTAYTTGPTLTEEKTRLETEKGVLGMEQRVGSFEEEISSTQNLLDQLEGDITQRTRDYLVSEPQRRRVLAAEQEPLMKQLGIAERGLTATTGRLERTNQDILTELGLIEKEKTMPLDLFERELNIRSKIKELTDKEIPGVISSTFDDEGNMTIVIQDPETGAFTTQTIKGIGQKADKYQSISSATDDQGNLTIIGITRDGKSEVIGTFKGVAGAKEPGKPTIAETTDEIGSYIQRRISEGEGWATIEAELRNMKIPTYAGSTADELLKKAFKKGKGTSNEDLIE